MFLTGRPFPASDPRSAGVGWAAVRDAVERAAGASPGAFGEAYDRSSDPGRAAFEVLSAPDARQRAATREATSIDRVAADERAPTGRSPETGPSLP